MATAKTIQKTKRSQCMNHLQTSQGYIIDCIALLEYDPEYIDIYILVTQSLRAVRAHDDDTPLHVYYEAMPDNDDKIDLGTRYKALLSYLDLFLDTQELYVKWSNTRV